MAFRVEITEEAERDAHGILDWLISQRRLPIPRTLPYMAPENISGTAVASPSASISRRL
jgi:hypothetical protein